MTQVNDMTKRKENTVAVNETYQKWVNAVNGAAYYNRTATDMVRDSLKEVKWADGAVYDSGPAMMIGLGILNQARDGDEKAQKKALNNELSKYRMMLARVSEKGYTATFKQKSKDVPRPHILVFRDSKGKKGQTAATYWKKGIGIYGIEDMVKAVRNDKDALKALAELIKS